MILLFDTVRFTSKTITARRRSQEKRKRFASETMYFEDVDQNNSGDVRQSTDDFGTYDGSASNRASVVAS